MDNNLYYDNLCNDAKEIIAIKKTNLEAMNKLIELQKDDKTIDPIEFEKYVEDLYEKI